MRIEEFLNILRFNGAMPTLVVGMIGSARKTQHAHDKRGHGTVFSARAII
jgi:hypothetical protein